MSKTIEEAAKRFADMKTTKQAGSSVERDKKALLMTQFFRYALEELPLSERLTPEEKERVSKMYKANWNLLNSISEKPIRASISNAEWIMRHLGI